MDMFYVLTMGPALGGGLFLLSMVLRADWSKAGEKPFSQFIGKLVLGLGYGLPLVLFFLCFTLKSSVSSTQEFVIKLLAIAAGITAVKLVFVLHKRGRLSFIDRLPPDDNWGE